MRRLINDFSAGELSPLLYGLTDNPAVLRGCRDGLNFIVLPSGGATRRPAMMHLGQAGGRSALIPFRYSATDAAMLEISPSGVQVWGSDGVPQGSVIPAPWTEAELPGLQWVQANNLVLVVCATKPPHRIERTTAGWEVAPVVFDWPALRRQNISEVTLTFTPDVPGDFGVGSTGTMIASGPTFADGHVGSAWELGLVRERPFKKFPLGEGSTKATAVFSMTADPADGEGVSIGDRVIVFKTTPDSAYQVVRGGGTAASAASMAEVINGEVDGTPAHPLVTAEVLEPVVSGVKASATLTATGNDLTSGTPDQILIGGVTYPIKDTLSAAYDVKRGATLADTLTNFRKAVNLTGVAGTDYGVGTLIHPDVSADAPIGGSITVRANVAGVGGNAITIEVRYTSRLTWNNGAQTVGEDEPITLAGGVDATTERVRITAKAAGSEGNGIALADTAAAGSWSGAATAGGVTVSAQSDWLRVVGKWEVFSVGEWYGDVRLVTADGETLRPWASDGDFNIQASGTVDDETMRLEFTGSGTFAATPGLNAPNPRAQLTAVDAEIRGVVQIDSVVDDTVVRVTVTKPLQDGTPTNRWAEGAFSDYRGFPRAISFHDQRLILGGVLGSPLTVWGSVTADLLNFRRTGLDDGGLSYDLASTDSAPIAWIASQSRGLIIGTESQEWLMVGSGDGPITPNAVDAKVSTAYGSGALRPVMAGGSILFAQSGARTVREFVFAWDQQNFVAPDILELSDHLPASGIRGLAVARKPFSQIFAVLNDGRLLSCTFRRAEGGTMIAWTPVQTDGLILAVAVLQGDAEDDQVWLVVERAGVQYVERFGVNHIRNAKSGAQADFAHLDSCSQHSGTVITGLDRFNGRTVAIQVDGAPVASRQVSGGSITLPEAGTKVFVGLPYESRLRPMPFETPLQDGGASGRKQKLAMASALVHRSGPFEYQDGDGGTWWTVDIQQAQVSGVPAVLSGWQRLEQSAEFRDSVEFTIRTRSTLPLNLLAVSCAYGVYGS